MSGSNSAMSSGFSPRPMNFTGMSSWSFMAMTIPPRAVPSSFARNIPVTSIAFVNICACAMAFCPVVASSTSMTSVGALGILAEMTFFIFVSCLIRSVCVWSLPAVSSIR